MHKVLNKRLREEINVAIMSHGRDCLILVAIVQFHLKTWNLMGT